MRVCVLHDCVYVVRVKDNFLFFTSLMGWLLAKRTALPQSILPSISTHQVIASRELVFCLRSLRARSDALAGL